MAKIKKTLADIASIGTTDDPVARIYVTEIFSCKNISKEESTIIPSPETQEYKGIELEDGKVIIREISGFEKDIIIGVNSISGAGTGGLNFPGGGANAKITGTFIVTGLITAGGGITLGANMTTGAHWIRGSGANVGQKFTGEDVEFSGTVTTPGGIILNGGTISNDGGGLEGISINNTGDVTCYKDLNVNDDIFCNQIETTGDIQSDTFIDANTGFKKGGTAGITGTFDPLVDNTLIYTGGIITAKT